MSSLRDTERMQPDELPDEQEDPTAHASEHVAPHPVPRISAHKTMELDTVKVADPGLNSRNAKTMRVLRPPVVPSVDPGAGYAYDDLSPPSTKSPWMLIGGAVALVVLVGAGVLFASSQGAQPAPSALTSSQEPSAKPSEAALREPAEPASAASAAPSAPEVASAGLAASAEAVPRPEGPSPEHPSAPKASPTPEAASKAASKAPAPAAPTAKPAAPKATSKPAAPKGKPDWEEWM